MLRILLMPLLLMLAITGATMPCAARAYIPQGAASVAPVPRFAYIELLPMEVTESSEQAIIVVTLEVAPDKKAAAENLSGRLREAFLHELHDYPEVSANMMQGKTIDAAAMKAHLMKAAEKIADPGLIHDMTLDIFQGRI